MNVATLSMEHWSLPKSQSISVPETLDWKGLRAALSVVFPNYYIPRPYDLYTNSLEITMIGPEGKESFQRGLEGGLGQPPPSPALMPSNQYFTNFEVRRMDSKTVFVRVLSEHQPYSFCSQMFLNRLCDGIRTQARRIGGDM